ncbi:unannotated protein [freshwater metagenome]|uniref:Unannotated protein n=1 Tax=freshwater metagenome TaxID=449393 RepID=A0A6J7DPI2_9ZZZZ
MGIFRPGNAHYRGFATVVGRAAMRCRSGGCFHALELAPRTGYAHLCNGFECL